jgi:peptidoglycan/LPS O-acetylase OafA/YrhL
MGYVRALDGIRGIAILLVISSHYFGLPGGGPLGVGLFFVLSGFLITTLLLEEHHESGTVRLAGFYARRARRLFPALAVLLVVYAAVTGAFKVVAMAGLYTGNFFLAFRDPSPLANTALSHLWSLAQEEQFYFVWPLLLLILLRSRRALWIVAGLTLAFMAYRGVYISVADVSVNRTYAPDMHSDWLLAGAVLAFARRRGFAASEPVAIAGFVILFAGVVVNPWTPSWFVWQAPIFLAGCTALVAVAYSPTQMRGLLSTRPLVWLGRISYSLYLWHVPVYAVLSYKHPLVALLLSIAVAWLSYAYVEQPLRARGTRTTTARESLVPVVAD